MASERRAGAGARLSGVLERATPPNPVEPEETEQAAEPSQGRAVAPKKAKSPTPAKRTGRTIYLGDDLFERIIVQAHRRGRTISEYVAGILERQVPDHRVIRSKEADQGDTEAA